MERCDRRSVAAGVLESNSSKPIDVRFCDRSLKDLEGAIVFFRWIAGGAIAARRVKGDRDTYKVKVIAIIWLRSLPRISSQNLDTKNSIGLT